MPEPSDERRELWICLAVAAAIVALQSIVPLTFEQYFDSDQAVYGLMAKHLSEGRAFPLFFYGQNYMLAVESWMAVPFFWIGGPTVAMLRTPLILVNLFVALGFIWFLTTRGLRPRYALIAALPVTALTPAKAMEFGAVLGAATEPFAYVLLLWVLRYRPLAFGALLAFGTLHREFTFLALPALAIACWRDRALRTPSSLALRAAGFIAVYLVADVIKRNVNIYGPAGGTWVSGSVAMGAQTFAKWLTLDVPGYLARVWHMATWGLPDMFGGRRYAVSEYQLPGQFEAGSAIVGAVFAAALLIAIGRILWLRREPTRPLAVEWPRFGIYLALVGLLNVLVVGLNSGIDVRLPPVLRYALLAPLLPVAILAFYFVRESSPRWRAAVGVAVVAWAASTAVDNARFALHLDRNPPPRYHRRMADYLTGMKITHARANYWDAYVITFLSREQVIVASTGTVRVSVYQADVDRHAGEAVNLVRLPCEGGPRVAAWCVVPPGGR